MTTFKLSEKALKKIQDEMEHGEYQIPCGYENVEGMSIYHLAEHDFESNDFEDCVMLTIKEAKEILQSSYDVLSWARVGPTHMNNALNVQELLKYRIEQAEAVK